MTGSPRFYGWTIAITLWFTYLLSSGLPFYGASVMNAAMGKALALDKTTIGVGFSVTSLVWGFVGPLVAFLLNRRGLRFTVAFGALIIATGALLLGLVVNSGLLYILVYGLIVGAGLGFASNLPTQTGVTLWFTRKRALVMSLVMTATGAGGFLAPPLLNRIIEAGSWQTAWLFVAAGSVLCAALAWLFLRDRPSDLGQYPDGIAPSGEGAGAHAGERWTTAAILRRPAFWQILFGCVVCGAPTPLLIAHGVPHLERLGHAPAVGAWALGLMLLCSVPGRVVAGFLCDRYPPRYVWAVMLALVAAGVAMVINATSTTQIGLFAVLLGFGFGGSIICWIAMTANYFGPASFATVMGLQTPVTTVLVSAMPTLAGILYDRVGTYSLVLWAVAIAALLGILLVIGARPPAPHQPTPALA